MSQLARLILPVLLAPDIQKQFKFFVDASDVSIGAVLFQEDPHGVDHPVCVTTPTG